MKKLLLFFMLTLAAIPVFAEQSAADKLVGIYSVIEPDVGTKSKVQISKQKDGTYQGVVIWCEKKVPDNKKVILKGFRYDSANKMWTGGTIYNPANDKSYKSQLSFDSTTKLKVRGYIGTPALGKTVYWTKIQ